MIDTIYTLLGVYFLSIPFVLIGYLILGGLRGGVTLPLSALEEAGFIALAWPILPILYVWHLAVNRDSDTA